MKALLLLAFIVIAGVLLAFRSDVAFLANMGTFEIVLVAGGVLLIVLYILLLLYGERSRPLQALRYLFIWAVIAFGLVAGYSYREELSVIATRVAGELVPPGQIMTVDTGASGEAAVRVRRRLDGHFAVRGSVNGETMMMLVDTGASTVVLKPSEAERAGINVGDLDYTVPVHTANGTAYAAPVRLHSVAIGPVVIDDVEALVARPGSVNENLLGMSFLRRLRSYEFSRDFLTLRG
jgi:aspartyl protease family protein